MRIPTLLIASLLSMPLLAAAQLAQHPPMGWNSWDSYGLTITESQFRANAAVEAKMLLRFGWNYAVIDEGWFLENPQDRPTPAKLRYATDAFGRYIPVPTRFPSAGSANTTSFAPLAAWVHAQGLKFGIHIVRGIPRVSVAKNTPIEGSAFHAQDAADTHDACPWDPTNWGVRDNAAGQAWYDSLFHQYAVWGVDLVKVDCIGDHPYAASEIRMIHRAIEHSGRPMVLSISPGPMNLTHAEEIGTLANMWRISDDEWDVWSGTGGFPQGVKDQFPRAAAWAKYARPGNWPDADMLAIGELRPSPGYGAPRISRLSHAEQRSLLTLWSMARSPLILGANLTLLDAWTTKLLTTRDVLRIDQTALASRELSQNGGIIVWTADLPHHETALAVFNTGEAPAQFDQALSTYGISDHRKAHDAWSGEDLGAKSSVHQTIMPHDCILWLLR